MMISRVIYSVNLKEFNTDRIYSYHTQYPIEEKLFRNTFNWLFSLPRIVHQLGGENIN